MCMIYIYIIYIYNIYIYICNIYNIYIYVYIYICIYIYRVITVKKTTYLDEKYFRLTFLSIRFIYICLKTVT